MFGNFNLHKLDIQVAGLAKRENDAVDCGPEDLDPGVVRQYVLRGMVVHSGQASGGHYYSYIRLVGGVGFICEVNFLLETFLTTLF